MRRRGAPTRGGRAPESGHGHGNGTNGTVRVPPHDLEAERALIGAMLLPGSAAVETAMAAVGPGDFYKPAHGFVVGAIYTLAAVGSAIDPVTVIAQLRDEGLLEASGGDAVGADLISMMGGVPHSAGAASWAAIVAATARRRHMRSVAASIDDAAQDGDEEALERALEAATEVAAVGRPELVVEDLGAVIRGEEPEIVPTLLCRSDGQALIYPGLLHWVMGEPACGKTWLALVAALAGAQSGVDSLYLDYEGSRRIVGARLARLGAAEANVDHIAYVRPSGGSPTTGPAALRLVRERSVGLVVVDGAAKAMARDGLDEDKAADVLGWLERMVWPLCEVGATVVILDHVTKDKDSRGRWARGNGAKLGEVDGAAYSVEVAEAWSRARSGSARIRVAKDREGVVGAVGEVVAMLRFVPGDDQLRISVDVPHGTSVANTITAAIEAVLTQHAGIELSQRRLEEEVRSLGQWRNDVIRSTAEHLANARRIHMRIGSRNARLYSALSASDEAQQGGLDEDF